MPLAVVKKLLLAAVLTFTATAVSADRRVVIDSVSVEQIVADVVGFTVQRAADELLQISHVNVEQRGYSERHSYTSHRVYQGRPARIDRASRDKLRQLKNQHQRTLAHLERDLDKDLRELGRDFADDARETRDRRKLAKKRQKFQRKVDKAYSKFSAKVDKANYKFDRKRADILQDSLAYRFDYDD